MRSFAAAALAVLLAACTTTTPSTPPASGPGPSNASQAPASPCPIAAQEGRLLSDRLVSASLQPGPGGDRLAFLLGPRSNAPTQPKGYIDAVQPPFTMAGSGEAVTVAGDRFFRVRFEGMYLYNDAGAGTYTGSRRLTGQGGSIAEAVIVDESEGYVTWIVGVRGTGCVTLEAPTTDELIVTVSRS